MDTIFKPSFILLAGGIVTNPSAQSYIDSGDTTEEEPNPYVDGNMIEIDD